MQPTPGSTRSQPPLLRDTQCSGLISLGQEITMGVRVPPKSAAISFVQRNGVSAHQAQAEWYMLSTFGVPITSSPPSLFVAAIRSLAVLGIRFGD